MDELKVITIENTEMQIKEYNGQRVVTFKDIDTVHERPDGTAKRSFNKNKKHFVEGEDYIKICVDEIRTNKLWNISNKARADITLLTESGYLMIVKTFTDDLSWKVQRQLVNSYFKAIHLNKAYIPRKSSVPAPLNDNWYKQNRPRLKALCKKFDIKTKTLLSQLLHRLDMTYDTEACKHIYEKEKGYPPTYATDIIGYFPELEQRADELLRIIEEK